MPGSTSNCSGRRPYQHFFGNYGGAIDYFTHKPGVGDAVPRDLYEGEVPVERVGYYTQLLADASSDWLRQRRAGTPFFLSLHFTAPHWPWVGPEDEAVSRSLGDLFHYDGGNLEVYSRMVRSLDAAVGQVLEVLDTQGLSENKHPEVFVRLRNEWLSWNEQFPPITDEVSTHGVTPDVQADRYAPERSTRERL